MWWSMKNGGAFRGYPTMWRRVEVVCRRLSWGLAADDGAWEWIKYSGLVVIVCGLIEHLFEVFTFELVIDQLWRWPNNDNTLTLTSSQSRWKLYPWSTPLLSLLLFLSPSQDLFPPLQRIVMEIKLSITLRDDEEFTVIALFQPLVWLQLRSNHCSPWHDKKRSKEYRKSVFKTRRVGLRWWSEKWIARKAISTIISTSQKQITLCCAR